MPPHNARKPVKSARAKALGDGKNNAILQASSHGGIIMVCKSLRPLEYNIFKCTIIFVITDSRYKGTPSRKGKSVLFKQPQCLPGTWSSTRCYYRTKFLLGFNEKISTEKMQMDNDQEWHKHSSTYKIRSPREFLKIPGGRLVSLLELRSLENKNQQKQIERRWTYELQHTLEILNNAAVNFQTKKNWKTFVFCKTPRIFFEKLLNSAFN